jgi:phosphate transport system substrate-binding protein
MRRRQFLSRSAGTAAGLALAPVSLRASEHSLACSHPIRMWGHGALAKRLKFVEGLVGSWQAAFRVHNPDVCFEDHLSGTAAAIGALYTGQGELAFMGREIWSPEVEAFREVKGYAPTGVEVMTGSLDVRNKGYAIAMFTHRDNPISGLTLEQIDAIYSIERRRGHVPVSKWSDLGVTGPLADKQVNLYGFPIARGFAQFMEDRVFEGSTLWNPELREFPDKPNSVSVETDGAKRMLVELANDPAGMAYAGLMYANPGVRVVPVAERTGETFVAPTKASVRNRTYPLARIISMFIDLPPNSAGDDNALAFLKFILSPEGQEIVARDGGGYLPLTDDIATAQIKKLGL